MSVVDQMQNTSGIDNIEESDKSFDKSQLHKFDNQNVTVKNIDTSHSDIQLDGSAFDLSYLRDKKEQIQNKNMIINSERIDTNDIHKYDIQTTNQYHQFIKDSNLHRNNELDSSSDEEDENLLAFKYDLMRAESKIKHTPKVISKFATPTNKLISLSNLKSIYLIMCR